MSDRQDQGAPPLYRGVRRRIVEWFDVPRDAPSIPQVAAPPAPPTPPIQADAAGGADGVGEARGLLQLRPDPAYLHYLKLGWRIAFGVIAAPVAIGCIALLIVETAIGVLVAIAAAALLIVLLTVTWTTLHLRYDTTWYVLTDRSLRLRRGVWVIREMTVTFENVQNVRMTQGPIERLYGIRRLVIETAGGGAVTSPEQSAGNSCMLEGLANAEAVRDLIMARVRRSRAAGLGDSPKHDDAAAHRSRGAGPAFSARHIEALRALRDEARALARVAAGADE